MIQTDYLIIGSGIAGLTFALKTAERFPDRSITIVTKSTADESNTKYAQGGIAVVQGNSDDSFKKHIEDTLICGDGLCDKAVVEMVVTEGPKRLQELIDWGARFDNNAEGHLDLGREGGHSKNRVVHYKDQTGLEIERAILLQVHKTRNIIVYDFHFALNLITQNDTCLGACVLNEQTHEVLTFQSDYTVLATGGIGQLYGHTTNPAIATGDGIAMANRAGAAIKEMEFIQFHPTALYNPNSSSTFLISEAVRGFGAYLRTKVGRRFMLDYDERGDLASRDIVSQSIEKELKRSGDACVYLDCTHLNSSDFKNHFPMIYENCRLLNIAIEKDWIPVMPAQHYLCGGISVNQNGQTSVTNLFACGECARTGLHGANRLASNSLLEALVYADNIYRFLAEVNEKKQAINCIIPECKSNYGPPMDIDFLSKLKSELQLLMQQNVGIVRNDTDLFRTQMQLKLWQNQVSGLERRYRISKEIYELKNMINVGILIVEQSIKRQENRGGFVKEYKKLQAADSD
ncbi:L-aspartate oxidase [Flavobacterium silvisoli]|uniref:L-aspartate oxidase n=1 Tax=Flavobacterium silvisoli TaxID=2529433 RepID=A0A4Q9YTU7_9FLAO|nr:L-aspartate oxidase [Flavobacterium silvisoli]TBX67018.1 L-aspartate oxidase [Flavobacterium silvisoli]